jgi:hypothetical protein
MPSVRGTVRQIFVNPAFGCVSMQATSGQNKLMLLWSYTTQEDNATNRLLHGSYLALTRDALTNNKEITYAHATGSALVDSVTLHE